MELVLFYLASAVALVSTVMVLTQYNAAHALVYLIISLLSAAVIFYVIGAPFAAILEVLVYAGAIMVMFVFVVMILNMGRESIDEEHQWLKPRMWIVPSILTLILLGEMVMVLTTSNYALSGQEVAPKTVALELFGPYVLAVELASMLLLAGLVGAYQLGRRAVADAREEVPSESVHSLFHSTMVCWSQASCSASV